ncbi:sialin [Drosophila grimshawi]|uniref:GH18362 n=1 Tax=Drosophila grimshawi TaxID=7222 RepID=B4JEX7_DROGR|nr:sialin [Drosophila grimshawi]EDV93258.1 GH18362 [Drosophila grimshawi]
MVIRSWNVPHLGGQHPGADKHSPLWGSVRLTYTLCAFLTNMLQMGMRNMLGLVILRMVKARPEDVLLQHSALASNQANNLTDSQVCGSGVWHNASLELVETGDLPWTRNQELTFPGVLYYGYVIALPLAGHLTDRFGGKVLFINSMTMQALSYIALPVMAEYSYVAAVIVMVFSGIFAGCGSPPLYQLFLVWAHPTERTSMLSFAYSGLIVGSIGIYPLASYLSDFGWRVPFYVLGNVALLYGISCNWLIYNTLEQHPRLTDAERDYLKPKDFAQAPQHLSIPWRSLLTSVPVYAFMLTHVFHNCGFLVFSLIMPRFMQEAMQFNMKEIGFLSSAPFIGSMLSKLICIFSCSYIERRLFLNLGRLRRLLYAVCTSATIVLIGVIIVASCQQKALVLLIFVLVGATMDMGFSGGYWPTLLYFAPSFAGMISGLANSLGHLSGFLAPHLIAILVHTGIKSEWNAVLLTLMLFNALAIIVFGLFSSTTLQTWDPRSQKSNLTNSTQETTN